MAWSVAKSFPTNATNSLRTIPKPRVFKLEVSTLEFPHFTEYVAWLLDATTVHDLVMLVVFSDGCAPMSVSVRYLYFDTNMKDTSIDEFRWDCMKGPLNFTDVRGVVE